MDAKERRESLLAMLKTAMQPLTGTMLAKTLKVSRQIIVGDIAILRAAGTSIIATPQGYMLPAVISSKVTATFACQHGLDQLGEELAVMIDNGGKVLDVAVEHPLYGEIKANLMLSSRRDLADFLQRLKESKAEPLLALTGGIHLHTVEADSEEILTMIKEELSRLGILIE